MFSYIGAVVCAVLTVAYISLFIQIMHIGSQLKELDTIVMCIVEDRVKVLKHVGD